MIVIVWHVLAHDTDYKELGYDYFQRLNDPESQKRRLIRQLEALGVKVTLEPAA